MKRVYLFLTLALLSLSAAAQKFDLQGHQGARGLMPENTIEGMLKALDFGVTTLDMDAVITKDRQVVLSHEPYFNNEISLTPEGKEITLKDQKKYNIFQMDYEQVKKFDVGSKVNRRFPGQQKFKAYKPLLAEVIDSVEAYVKKKKLKKPTYTIETSLIRKGDVEFQPEASEFVELIMDVVKDKKLSKRVVIQSLDIRTLQYLHAKYPKIKTSLMIDEKVELEENIKTLGFTPTVYSPYYVLVGKGLVERCHELGIKIIPWTVNSSKQMKYLMDLGVDGLVTDYPNLYSIVAK
ncbi:MAG: glycerophosphodiester phosphodiesterase [Pedobacter sp.]|jgi:glycerophosphoryl diester phosphodiesterase|nr:glycerophosphodiester phosphodiesterase [Pedobacter sp.]